jgi:diacylglycerol O-acyltransferase / wax synthase
MPIRSGDRLPPEDAAFLYLETQEMPLHIGSVSVLDGKIGFEEYVEFISSKLPLIRRYRQRLVTPPFHLGHPIWQDDPDFDIRNHIHHAHLKRGTMAELQRLAGQIFGQVMDRNKPLWDLTLVDGLGEGQCAFISRVHHCLVDGVSGVGIINVMLSPTREAEPAPTPEPFQAEPLPGPGESMLDALATSFFDSVQRILSAQMAVVNVAETLISEQVLSGWSQFAQLAPELVAPVERLPFNQKVRGPRKVAWTEFPISDVSAIRKALGGTLNDVVLTALTIAVRRYAELHGQSMKNRLLRLMVPVNLRRDEKHHGFGNRVSAMPVNVPLDIDHPAELLKAVRERTEAMKRAHVADLIQLSSAWMGVTPVPLQAVLWTLADAITVPPFNMVCTNVPGPQYPLYLLGREMLTFHPYVPIGGEMGVNCAIQSYNGKLYFGLTADSAAAPDVRRLNEFLEEAFGELRQAAGVLEPQRETAVPQTTDEKEVRFELAGPTGGLRQRLGS